MRKDLYLDYTTNDLSQDNNFDLKFTDNLGDFVSQKIDSKLKIFKGEWFLDESIGVPYIEQVFLKNPDINLINTIFKNQLKNIEEVSEILTFDIEFDTGLRTYQINWVIKAIDNSIIDGYTEV